MFTDRPIAGQRNREYADDIGIRDVKFALTGIGICVAIAILLMLVG
jgi:hypothetical protein